MRNAVSVTAVIPVTVTEPTVTDEPPAPAAPASPATAFRNCWIRLILLGHQTIPNLADHLQKQIDEILKVLVGDVYGHVDRLGRRAAGCAENVSGSRAKCTFPRDGVDG
ncbi:MAG TPA: hypothetical protein VMN56_08730 [Casimicrobiaceae bacterium]|nr:hypothetical protein [Casimicrobiaceae bacterium]